MDLGRLCWAHAHHFIDFEQRLLLGTASDSDHPGVHEYETGYAVGMRNAHEDALQQLEMEGVDVLEAATGYAEAEDVELVSLWIADHADEMDVYTIDDVGLYRQVRPTTHFSSIPFELVNSVHKTNEVDE